ncbi:hypothetical protein ABFV62_25680, partial [Pseudomonas syringae]|uniref:hypothetical protein n=1 Tax=Pseudomonas syringae TaxID=317 RepID=UPI0034D3E2BD
MSKDHFLSIARIIGCGKKTTLASVFFCGHATIQGRAWSRSGLVNFTETRDARAQGNADPAWQAGDERRA